MNKANNAVYDYGQAFSELGKMRDMVNDLSLGDIITQEDYEMLCKYNDEIARYFRMLGDGSYELVGDPLDAI
jgi:hypothetical protein